MKIGDREIGKGHPIFIIAEAGVNHNGNLDLAKKLIDAAAEAKADAVKFQTFQAETLLTQNVEMAEYQKANTGEDKSQFEMIKELELPRSWHSELKQYAELKGLIFMSTPFSLEDAEYLRDLGVKALKIGSTDTNNIPYLKKIAKYGIPIILSTGMSDLQEIKESVDVIKSLNSDLVVLQCTTNYPTLPEHINLNAMQTIEKEFDVPTGFSDHSERIEADIVAVSLGAAVVEKHFTLDRNLPGPDHKASLEPHELKNMVNAIRHVEKNKITDPKQALERVRDDLKLNLVFDDTYISTVRGDGVKRVLDAEKKVAEVARKSVVAKTDITEGSVLTEDLLTVKRPGTGLKPKYLGQLLGKKTKKPLKADDLLKLEDVE